jgi:rRNA maturation endonuclease Nob1
MKYKLDSLEGLSEEMKALYEEKDGAFYLKIEGLPQQDNSDIEGLKKKNEELLAEKKAEQKKRQEAEDQARRETEEAARKKGDIAALEASWQTKLEQAEAKHTEATKALQDQVYKLTVGQTAQSLASELSIKGSEAVLLPHITNRLQVETTESGEVKVRVLDSQGKPSALSIDDLKKEFRGNVAFKPLIVASNASGSGASGGGSGGGAAKKPSEMTTQERLDFQKNDPQGFQTAVANGEFNN